MRAVDHPHVDRNGCNLSDEVDCGLDLLLRGEQALPRLRTGRASFGLRGSVTDRYLEAHR
jgi:hypothetical protein